MHIPVLTKEVMQYLKPKSGGIYIDATLNGGGHARAILKETGPRGCVLGIELDENLADMMKKEKIGNLIVANGSYKDMKRIAARHSIKQVDGVLFDFGMSSWHIESSRRGFSFLRDEILDMRYSKKSRLTAAEIVNTYSEKQLADMFWKYGQESRSRIFAHKVASYRKNTRILTTFDFIKALGIQKLTSKRHPATKIFQALRIAVNDELRSVEEGLRAAMDIVRKSGHVVAISFHSLEDAIVKNTFAAYGRALTKRPVFATHAEITFNPRSRSARLRAWEKV